MYESLTKYLLEFPDDEKGMWIIDKENDGTPEHPIQMPYVNYSRLVRNFTDDVYSFVDKHEEMGLRSYAEILNNTYKVQMPVIIPHVCRHTYCSNMAKAGMNPKTLQYLMGHSDISVTMNVYTHIGFDDAEEELKRMEEFRKAQAEIEQKKKKPMSQKMFKAI